MERPVVKVIYPSREYALACPLAYATSGSAGFDLRAKEDQIIVPHSVAKVNTGLRFEIPQGYEMQIRGRSGLAFKQQIWGFNGTVDSDYRGIVMVLLENKGDNNFYIMAHDRIAQAVIAPVSYVRFETANRLSESIRGAGGFGSTGEK